MRIPLRWRAWLLLALPSSLLPLGCTMSFDVAVGPNGDVTVFSDFAVGDARRDLLRQFLGRKLPTPVRPEAPFRVEMADSSGFRSRRDWRNLVFLGNMASRTWAARLCTRVVGDEARQRLTRSRAGYAFVRNMWADGQTVLFVHAEDEQALSELLQAQGRTILERFENLVIEGLKETLFVSGEQAALADGIRRRHGYRIRIPEGVFVEEQTSNRFVRLKEVLPSGAVMYLFAYYQDQVADTLNASLCVALRDTLAAVYCAGDRVEPSRTEVKRCRFLGREALEIHGLYQNFHPPMGGPFKLFCFHDGGRLYLIDLAVFNPPADKTPELRILEAIARTFQMG